MNDWTQETANNYESFLAEECAAAVRKDARAAQIEEGSKILVTNNKWQGRRTESPTWHTVAKVTRYSDGVLEITCTDGRALTERDLILVETSSTATETLLVCLNDRATEFRAALSRSKDENLEVYPDFERDHFVVVNKSKESEYRVHIFSRDMEVFANCECPDFIHRNRVCKHQSAVLKFAFSGLAEKLQEPQIKRYYASYEAGNMKRQNWKDSGYFDTQAKAVEFVEKGIGSLQGQGSVSLDGAKVWAYEPEYCGFY